MDKGRGRVLLGVGGFAILLGCCYALLISILGSHLLGSFTSDSGGGARLPCTELARRSIVLPGTLVHDSLPSLGLRLDLLCSYQQTVRA